MRITIDIQQAPGSSYFHLADVNAVEDAILDLCLDEDAKISVLVEPELGENITVPAYR